MLKSRLHRGFGKLHLARRDLAEAAKHFAEDAYESALALGPESLDAADAYFYLAETFAAQGRAEASLALFDKVVDCWYKRLVESRPILSPASGGGGAGGSGGVDGAEGIEAPEVRGQPTLASGMSRTTVLEALQKLARIAAIRETTLGADHIACGEAHFTEALLLWSSNQLESAERALEIAVHTYQTHLGADHASTLDATETLRAVRTQQSYDHA